MEMELSNIIEKIKSEGVEEARAEGEKILSDAKARAESIVEEAERAGAKIIKDAEAEAVNVGKRSNAALRQASRDVLLLLKERVTELFGRIVGKEVSKELAPGALKDLIVKAVKNFRSDRDMDIEVLVSEKDKGKIEQALFAALGEEAKKKVSLRASSSMEGGFRIGEEGKGSYFDFSDEAITSAFRHYLNPKLSEMLDISEE